MNPHIGNITDWSSKFIIDCTDLDDNDIEMDNCDNLEDAIEYADKMRRDHNITVSIYVTGGGDQETSQYDFCEIKPGDNLMTFTARVDVVDEEYEDACRLERVHAENVEQDRYPDPDQGGFWPMPGY